MLKPIKIIFNLDGTGVSFDPSEPILLDALLAWALAPFHCTGEPPARDEQPADIPLPLGKWRGHGAWGWTASAIFPDGPQFDGLTFWRKRFRTNRAELTAGTINTQNTGTRDYNMPLPLLLCTRMVAWALGDRKRVEHILRKQVKYLGKKRSHGHGLVNDVSVEWCEDDFSLTRDGRAMRWLPQPGAARIVRPRPPYWNIIDAIPSCEIGDKWSPPC